MRRAHTRSGWLAPLLIVQGLVGVGLAESIDVQNLTGLPVYPGLTKAVMDHYSRTDTLGRRCSRFSGETSYPLDAVEIWYRKTLRGASETDLINDNRYKNYLSLSGIKLAIGIDYVTVYRVANQTSTSIELFRCSPIA